MPLAKFRRSWCELDTARSTPPGCGRQKWRMLARRQLRSKRLRWPNVGSWRQPHSTMPVLMLKIVANDLRKASSVNAIALQLLTLFLRIWEEQAMVCEFQDMALDMHAHVYEFVEHFAEKKQEQDLVENAEALAWHEESVVTELRRELQQARFLVAQAWRSSQQRQLESAPMEPPARVPWDF